MVEIAQVSVIIPVYNIEAHLEQCLDSIASQTLHDIEVICVDDGSTDRSPEILSLYAAQDSRFSILTQQNAGPGAARNAGFEQASGEFVIFLDSDDWFEANFLEEMVCAAANTQADVTICRCVQFDTNSLKELSSKWMLKTHLLPAFTFSPDEVAPWLFQFTYGMPWDKLYRMGFLRNVGLAYPPLRNSEDLAFVFPSLIACGRIHVINQCFIHHRVNRMDSVSNSRIASPDDPFQAFMIVRDYLFSSGRYQQFEQSFINWAMEFLVWHVSSMSDCNMQKHYFIELREKWIPLLQFQSHPYSYYPNKILLLKYFLIKFAPFIIFVGSIHFYKWLKHFWKTG